MTTAEEEVKEEDKRKEEEGEGGGGEEELDVVLETRLAGLLTFLKRALQAGPSS